MVEDNLVNYRKELDSEFNDLWDDLGGLIARMKGDFTEEERANFKACTDSNGVPEGDNPIECLEIAAADAGVAATFRKKLNNQEGLVENLRSAGRKAARDNDVSDTVRDVANFSDTADLNKMCSRGEYNEVEDAVADGALSVASGSIDSFKDCVTVAAESTNLSEDLSRAYGTN